MAIGIPFCLSAVICGHLYVYYISSSLENIRSDLRKYLPFCYRTSGEGVCCWSYVDALHFVQAAGLCLQIYSNQCKALLQVLFQLFSSSRLSNDPNLTKFLEMSKVDYPLRTEKNYIVEQPIVDIV